jgi:predicted house-cleaning noncanonical NTP pyrophosphatase (MazG superfamily)
MATINLTDMDISNEQQLKLNKEIQEYCDFLKMQRKAEYLEVETQLKHPLSWELQKRQIEQSLMSIR